MAKIKIMKGEIKTFILEFLTALAYLVVAPAVFISLAILIKG